MAARAAIMRTVERRVVDHRSLRSRPQAMQVTLPYLRSIDIEAPRVTPEASDDQDALPERGRDQG
jgi:hypothetical protein